MALTLKSVGKGLKKLAKVAAPVVGFVNPVAGIALGAASGLGEGKKSLGSMAKGAAIGGAGAALGKLGQVDKLGALGGLKKLGGMAGNALGSISGTAINSLKNNQGGIDLGKLASLGLTASALKGSRDEANAAKKYNASNDAMRQALMAKLGQSPDYSALMERITQRPNYSF